MISRDLVTKALYEIIGDDLLNKAAVKDVLPNSVQITGKPAVKTIALGVSCSPEFIAKAIEKEADYLIVHHGLHIAGDVVRGRFDAIEHRLKAIIKNELTLAGFHYSLDAHPEIGNNAMLIKKLGANRLEEAYFDGWGYVAEFSEPLLVDELIAKCEKVCDHPVYSVTSGPKKIRRIGLCSGGAKPHGETFLEIIDKNLDAIITGEISESGPSTATEGGYHYLACGHYATETFGVEALGQKLRERFGIDVQIEFIDVPSPL